jgi:hypothetical protein
MQLVRNLYHPAAALNVAQVQLLMDGTSFKPSGGWPVLTTTWRWDSSTSPPEMSDRMAPTRSTLNSHDGDMQ